MVLLKENESAKWRGCSVQELAAEKIQQRDSICGDHVYAVRKRDSTGADIFL